MKLVAITGGIGSGKSVVSSLLRMMGERVYDTDAQAKRLMNTSDQLIRLIKARFGDDVYCDGRIDNAKLGAIVFNNTEALADLNALVHPAVKADLVEWAHSEDAIAFFETALLYTGGLEDITDVIWKVVAPTEVRVERVVKRNGFTPEQVLKRILAQECELVDNNKDVVILNDGIQALVPQIVSNLSCLY